MNCKLCDRKLTRMVPRSGGAYEDRRDLSAGDSNVVLVCMCCDLSEKTRDCPHLFPEEFKKWNRQLKTYEPNS